MKTAFKVAQSGSYKWDIEVVSIAEDGSTVKSSFKVIFKRLKRSEADELRRKIVEDNLKFNDWMSDVLLGWEGVIASDGQPLEFSDENREIVFDITEAQRALDQAFWESVFRGKVKN